MADESEVLKNTVPALQFTANTFPRGSMRWQQWMKRAEAIQAVVAERDKLRQALEWIWHEMLVRGLDDVDTQTKLVELGLVAKVPADEQFREEWGADTMYVLAWKAKGATDE